MKFISFKTLKEIEKNNPSASKKSLFKAFIIGATVVGVMVVLAPSMKDNALFVSLAFGIVAMFSVYTNSMYQIKLLRDSGMTESGAEQEVEG